MQFSHSGALILVIAVRGATTPRFVFALFDALRWRVVTYFTASNSFRDNQVSLIKPRLVGVMNPQRAPPFRNPRSKSVRFLRSLATLMNTMKNGSKSGQNGCAAEDAGARRNYRPRGDHLPSSGDERPPDRRTGSQKTTFQNLPRRDRLAHTFWSSCPVFLLLIRD